MSGADPKDDAIIHDGLQVAPESMWLQRERLLQISARVGDAWELLRPARALPTEAAWAGGVLRKLDDLSRMAEALAHRVLCAIETYSAAEVAAQRQSEEACGSAMYGAGSVVPPIARAPFALGAGAGAGVLLLQPRARALIEAFAPSFSTQIRCASDGADDFLRGFTGLPRAKVNADAHVVADSITDVLDAGVAPPPILTVTRHRFAFVGPPLSVAEAFSRVPIAPDCVVVERYVTAEGVRWIVYVSGTQADPDGTNPFGFRSNLYAVAGEDSASMRAVREALRKNGVDAEEPITFVGYSQGALVANQLANEGSYTVSQVILAGAPLGTATMGAPVLNVRIDNDVVPETAGFTALAPNLLTYVAPAIKGATVAQAHAMSAYIEAGRRVDASAVPAVRSATVTFREFVPEGTRGVSQSWRAELQPAPSTSKRSRE